MSPLKSVIIDLSMLLVSLMFGAWLMGYFLAKARDVETPMERLFQSGTGYDWVQLTAMNKRDVCEEAAYRFQTDRSEMSAVCYYLYLEKAFSQHKSRNLLISDMLIEAEVHRSQVKPPPEIHDTII